MGFIIGNPDNRQGCTQALIAKCINDGQCKEDEVCRLSQGKKSCIPACTALNCGPGGICTARNHVAKCTCPPGKKIWIVILILYESQTIFRAISNCKVGKKPVRLRMLLDGNGVGIVFFFV